MVTQIDFEDVDELLLDARGMSNRPRSQLHRGQANAADDWHLVPTAFRSDARFLTAYGRETLQEVIGRESREAESREATNHPFPAPPREGRRESLEQETLVRFFNAADEAGLSLPEDSQVIRMMLADPIYSTIGWPNLTLRSILALAQHHKLPTRLLDWTWDPRIALFFAARDVFRQKERPDRFAVWTLDAGVLESEMVLRRIGLPDGAEPPLQRPYGLEIVTAPSATNDNLRAQKGAFTLLVPKTDQNMVAPDTPLDMLPQEGLPLTKRTLPSVGAPDLLKRLACEGVTSATIMPDFRGVVLSLEERSLWNR